jgi:hypothetical protein
MGAQKCSVIPKLSLSDPLSTNFVRLDPFADSKAGRTAQFAGFKFNRSNDTSKRALKPLFVAELSISAIEKASRKRVGLFKIQSDGIRVFSTKSALDRAFSVV